MKRVIFNAQVMAALDFSQKLSETGEHTNNHLTARDLYARSSVMAGTAELVFQVQDRVIESPHARIPVRIYRPSNRNKLPVTLYFHGGWFFAGGLDTHDRPLRALANASQTLVIAVDYRLAPEHPFPAAINDAYHALLWVISHGESIGADPTRIALAGDSAGGNIAAVIARKSIQNDLNQVRYQVLIYPVTDPSLSTESWREFNDGPVVSKGVAELAWAMYVTNDKDRQNPDVAPIVADDLKGLPRALVIVGEYDPLRDEGLAYAAKLRAADVQVTEHLYQGMPHGFFQMGGYIDEGRESIAEVGDAIRKVLKPEV